MNEAMEDIAILYEIVMSIEQNFSESPNALDIADSKISFDNVFGDNVEKNNARFVLLWTIMATDSLEILTTIVNNISRKRGWITNLIKAIINKYGYIHNLVGRISRSSFEREYVFQSRLV